MEHDLIPISYFDQKKAWNIKFEYQSQNSHLTDKTYVIISLVGKDLK